jgi:acetyl-CoA carboxylase biotin carboxyl carrier protein
MKTKSTKAPRELKVSPVASPSSPPAAPGLSIGGVAVAAIRELAEIVAEQGLSELKVAHGDGVLVLRRGAAGVTVSAAHAAHGPPAAAAHSGPAPSILHPSIAAPSATLPSPTAPASHVATLSMPPVPIVHPAEPAAASKEVTITSPFVGTFYRAPSPEAPNFVELGQRVKRGQVLCIVEAMKLMNEIEAELDGVIVSCLVENAQPVEYGQPLFKLAP